MSQFLTDEWFNDLERLTGEAGDLQIPAEVQTLKLDLAIQANDTLIPVSLKNGILAKGFHENAEVKMFLPADLAKDIFLELNSMAAMQGFMSGKIKVEGDISRLMILQNIEPTAQQQALFSKILQATDQ